MGLDNTGGGKILCPRSYAEGICGTEMVLLQLTDGTEWDKDWAHAFYFCSRCNRSLMVNRRIDTTVDPEERI